MARKGGLGRGLAALIPEGAPADERVPVTEVEIALVVPNPHQPRTEMDQQALDDLTQSISQHGVIQPLLVSSEQTDDGSTVYQLIAGERRLRAARAAGLKRVPVTIRQSTPQQLLELAIIENVQRADLNALEEAAAYRRLIEDFGLTQREVAERVGRSRTAVANMLRLTELSEELRASLARGEITEGHGRALLGIADPGARRAAWRRVVDGGLNVRQTEELARGGAEPRITVRDGGDSRARDADLVALEETVRRSLGTKVTLRRAKNGRGSLTIHFYSDEELEGVLERVLEQSNEVRG